MISTNTDHMNHLGVCIVTGCPDGQGLWLAKAHITVIHSCIYSTNIHWVPNWRQIKELDPVGGMKWNEISVLSLKNLDSNTNKEQLLNSYVIDFHNEY